MLIITEVRRKDGIVYVIEIGSTILSNMVRSFYLCAGAGEKKKIVFRNSAEK